MSEPAGTYWCNRIAAVARQVHEDGGAPGTVLGGSFGGPRAQDRQVGGDHYTRLEVQPWQAMQAWMSTEEFRGFLRGNAIKYLARAGSKGPVREDLEKARHYLDALIGEYPAEED